PARARKAGRGAIFLGLGPRDAGGAGTETFASWPRAILPMGASAARTKPPATLVDALGDAPSDGGSIPPASTLQGGDLPRTFASRATGGRSARSGNVPDPTRRAAVQVPRQRQQRARRLVRARGRR